VPDIKRSTELECFDQGQACGYSFVCSLHMGTRDSVCAHAHMTLQVPWRCLLSRSLLRAWS